MILASYDIIVVASSSGKDSLVALFEVYRLITNQQYPKSQVIVIHADLGRHEWPGARELAEKQAALFGFSFIAYNRHIPGGNKNHLLDYIRVRGKWPSRNQRFCTSEFKRDPGAKVVRGLSATNILYVFGYRKDESPERAKKKVISVNRRLSTKTRTVTEFLPVFNWSSKDVWRCIRSNNLPYHRAYDLGMPRLSCCFCIFSPFDALVIAGKENPELLEEYIAVEEAIQHDFKMDFKIAEVKKAIESDYIPGKVADWIM